MPADYVPYGPEWEAEMMSMRKVDLVDMVRRAMAKVENGSSHNSAMDAIAALKSLVSAIDMYNSNPKYVHAPWVRECNELSHARSVLQQHQ